MGISDIPDEVFRTQHLTARKGNRNTGSEDMERCNSSCKGRVGEVHIPMLWVLLEQLRLVEQLPVGLTDLGCGPASSAISLSSGEVIQLHSGAVDSVVVAGYRVIP